MLHALCSMLHRGSSCSVMLPRAPKVKPHLQQWLPALAGDGQQLFVHRLLPRPPRLLHAVHLRHPPHETQPSHTQPAQLNHHGTHHGIYHDGDGGGDVGDGGGCAHNNKKRARFLFLCISAPGHTGSGGSRQHRGAPRLWSSHAAARSSTARVGARPLAAARAPPKGVAPGSRAGDAVAGDAGDDAAGDDVPAAAAAAAAAAC